MTGLRRGWFHLASGAGLGRVFGFASNLLLSRWLGPTDLGLFNLTTTTVQTSDTLVRLGADYAFNFELGGHAQPMQTEYGSNLARGLVQICTLMSFLFSCFFGVWVLCGHGLFPSSLSAGSRFAMSLVLMLMISCEGCCASAWEILLVSQRTGSMALRQGLFFPLRLLTAAFGCLFGGILGAMVGWVLIASVQCFWLKSVLKQLWSPLKIIPFLGKPIIQLLRRGLPFYSSNLLSSVIFFPLLLKVASSSGLSEVGYLRVGQVLQQLFAFIPATLVPVLFLRLRSEPTFQDQVVAIEKPLRIIWLLLLEVLLLYCLIDRLLINWLFGAGFLSALFPTRVLLLTALLECLAQIVLQPLLAAGKTRVYSLWQNSAALIAGFLGWMWIPEAGLFAYLMVRLLYVIVPLIGYVIPVVQYLHEPERMLPLFLLSSSLLAVFSIETFANQELEWMPFLFFALSLGVLVFSRNDFSYFRTVLSGRA